MTCNIEIPSVANTMKITHLSLTIFNEFTSTYYEYKNDSFVFLFIQYTYNSVKNIDHSALIQEWKANTDNIDYKIKLNNKVKNPTKKREHDRSVDEKIGP